MIKDTYNDKSNEKVVHQEIIQSILKISKKIRYAGIINRFGRTITGKLQNGIIPILTPEQARDERYIESARQHLRRSLEVSIGRSIFTIEKNENVTFLLVPDASKDILYYITIEKYTTLSEIDELMDSIKKIITN
ncbi:MAG: hypothetical protein ACTHKC_05410 [Candidatus Nitrosocosmicus sp.]